MVRARPDPIAELDLALRREGRPTLAWVTEHAPDGDLGRVWRASADARALLRLALLHLDRREVVRAACACIRPVLQHVPRGEHRPRRALDAIEAWARGEAPLDAVRDAAVNAAAASATLRAAVGLADDGATAAAGAAREAASAATCADERGAADALAAAVTSAAVAGLHASRASALAEMAQTVRTLLPCPSLHELLALARRA